MGEAPNAHASFAVAARRDDRAAPAPRLLIFGAVAYANHLAHLARVTGWRPSVIDLRARFAAPARFPDAVEVIVSWPAPALQRLGGIDAATYIAVLSNDPKIDDEILRLALEAEPAYIGAMGSRHAQLERRERLLANGVSEAELARITAPVGLDLGALTAEETALSIMAELVAVRHGRSGRRLSELHGLSAGAAASPGTEGAGSPGAGRAASAAARDLDTTKRAGYSRAAQTDGAPAVSASSSQLAGAGNEERPMTRRAQTRRRDRTGLSCPR